MNLQPFGTLCDGRTVMVAEIAAGGLRARILTLGAILQDLRMDGAPWPLVLGGADLAAYGGPMRWFGAVVGPVANRIAGAQAQIGGTLCRFEANEGANLLHGGAGGTSEQLWQVQDHGADRLRLRLELPAWLGGFPGNRRISAEYRIAAPGTLDLLLEAVSDAPTLMNLAHHPYWNLDGAADTGGHRLSVAAARYLPTDAVGLPLGAPQRLDGEPRDLRRARALTDLPPLDHNYCLAESDQPLREVAVLEGAGGVALHLATTAPGLQVYDGAGLVTAPHAGHLGQPYGPYAGIALEPQFWPDAPAHAEFPSILLRPGTIWRQHTRYRLVRSTSGAGA